jgi:hypothetical protein
MLSYAKPTSLWMAMPRPQEVRRPEPEAKAQHPRPPVRPRVTATVRTVARWLWNALVVMISGPGLEATGGIDDSAFPSGFEAPYRRGSRQIRSLFHAYF